MLPDYTPHNRDVFLKATVAYLVFGMAFGYVVDTFIVTAVRNSPMGLKAGEGSPMMLGVYAFTTVVTSTLNVAFSAGLFTLAFDEARGKALDFVTIFRPVSRPADLLFLGVTGGILSFATWRALLSVLDGSIATLIQFLILILTGPFYMLVIPAVVEGASPADAVRDGIRIGLRDYWPLIKLMVRATLLSLRGLLFFLIGYIWTLPDYQRAIVAEYLEMKKGSADASLPPE